MKTYGELRRALKRKPAGWTLREGVPDDAPLPEAPLVLEKPPRDPKRKTTRAELRAILLKNPPGDPRLLVRAVKSGLLTRREAERRLARTWGPDFSLSDFGLDENSR